MNDTEKFLCWIAGGPGAVFQFRAIPEHISIRDRSRTRNFLGTFAEDGAGLTCLNANGYGIFAVVNETTGTRDEHVTRIRAVFADFDRGDRAEQQTRLGYFNLHAPISMVVQSSPGKFHAYWSTFDFPVERFKPFQQELAHVMSSDPTVSNPSHVMRVPGFLHQKSEPFRSRVLWTIHNRSNPHRRPLPSALTAATLETALAKTAKKFKIKAAEMTAPKKCDAIPSFNLEGVLRRVATAEPGERNNVLFGLPTG